MKIVKVVYHASGENQTTFDPLCFYDNFTGDINARTVKFASWDSDQYVEINQYQIRTLVLPDWMDESKFHQHHIKLRYAVAQVGEAILDWPETQLLNLFQLGHRYQYFIGWLLGKKKPTAFHKSLKDQMLNWLSEDTHHFGQPLSIRQWEAGSKHCPLNRADQIAQSTYNNR